MKKIFCYAIMMMALSVGTLGLTACGGGDDSNGEQGKVDKKHDISEWNAYAKTLTWTSATRVNNVLVFMSGNNAYDNEWTEFCVSYINVTKDDDTETIRNCHVNDLSAKTIINKNSWMIFSPQYRDGTVQIKDTGNKDKNDNIIYDITVKVKEMEDSQGKWADEIVVHYIGIIEGSMLTF